ncbi:MAG: tRNA (adenosine(37)-N6)-threonylcarbamoyltransferase complex dimerization subunit type 1 TsaB [Aggregatilineales bacterium]
MTLLLALDTATHTLSIALHSGEDVLHEQTWRTAGNHSVELAPAVKKALAQFELAGQPALSAVAVSNGPGTYTGLRVGVALAKAIASARGLPLVGISTLDVLAAGAPQTTGTLAAVLLAGRGRLVWSAYHWRKGRWKAEADAAIATWDELLSAIDGPTWVTGEISSDGRAALERAQRADLPITIVPAAARLRRAGYLAQLAWERLNEVGERSRELFAPAALVPTYIKTPDAP